MFGELVYRQGRAHAGLLLIRLHGPSPDGKAAVAAAAVEHTVRFWLVAYPYWRRIAFGSGEDRS